MSNLTSSTTNPTVTLKTFHQDILQYPTLRVAEIYLELQDYQIDIIKREHQNQQENLKRIIKDQLCQHLALNLYDCMKFTSKEDLISNTNTVIGRLAFLEDKGRDVILNKLFKV